MFSAPRIQAAKIAKKRGLNLNLLILSTDSEEMDTNRELNANNNGKAINEPDAQNKPLDIDAQRIVKKKSKYVEGD